MHFSHYGRMCPIETPEGPNIGLIGALSTLRPGQRVRLHRVAVPQGRSTARSPTRSCTWPPTRRRSTSSPRPTRRSTPTARSRTSACSCAARRRPPRLEDLQAAARARRASSAPPPTSRYVPPAEVQLMDVSPEADRLGRHGADPVPRARRRQPRPHGRQHAEAGRAAGAGRGAVHRHRHRGPRRPRRRRHDPGRRRRRRHRGRRRLDHRRVQDARASKVYRLLKFRAVEPGHLHQPEAARASRATRSRKGDDPRRRPLDRQRRAGARQEPARRASCRGRATTSRTPSSSPSAS